MDKTVHFRTIIPIYNLATGDFSLSGKFGNAKYKISVDYIKQTGKPELSKLNKYIDQERGFEIYNHIFFQSQNSMCGNRHCPIIIVDVKQDMSEQLWVAGNSLEQIQLNTALISALSTLTTRGILIDYLYSYRLTDLFFEGTYPEKSTGLSTSSFFEKPIFFSHGEQGLTTLDEKHSKDLELIFDCYLKLDSTDDSSFKNILQLSTSYYLTSLCLSKIEHAFLMLVIILEIIYKVNEEENFDKTVKRCRIVLDLKKAFATNFFNDEQTGVRELRNAIAHGKLFDTGPLKEKYDKLFKFVRHSIINLIIKQNEYVANDQKDWYKNIG